MMGSTMQARDRVGTIRRLFSALAVAGLVGGTLIGPVLAQDRDRGRADQRDQRDRGDPRDQRDRREVRAPVGRGHRQGRPAYGYDAPTYVQAPPPVVYAPPAPSAGLNLMFSFR